MAEALLALCDVRVQHVPGLLTPFFTSTPVERYSHAAACDLELYGAWCRALLL